MTPFETATLAVFGWALFIFLYSIVVLLDRRRYY